MKGWLIGRGWNLERTHVLGDLLAEVEIHGVTLEWFGTDAEILTETFIHARYPSDEPIPSLEETNAIFRNIERLFSELGVNL